MRLSLARQAPADGHAKERPGSLRFIRLMLLILLLAWAVRSFLFAPFSIPSGSMLPALLVGDYLLVSKWPYGYSRHSFPLGVPAFDGRLLADLPERGEIVVFKAPARGGDFVKRVVGLPGDTVELRGGAVVLNGKAVPRQAEGLSAVALSADKACPVAAGAAQRLSSDGRSCFYPAFRETLPGGRSYRILDQGGNAHADDLPAVTVPPGHVFLLGDNRDDSLDSRYPRAAGGIGFVPVENLIGRAALIFWSSDGTADYLKPWTWFSALRSDRLGRTFGSSE